MLRLQLIYIFLLGITTWQIFKVLVEFLETVMSVALWKKKKKKNNKNNLDQTRWVKSLFYKLVILKAGRNYSLLIEKQYENFDFNYSFL